MKTILITGAAGNVGSHLRRELAGKYNLRLSDIVPIKELAPGEKSARGDVAKMADMLRVTKGVDAIVHLGGFSAEGPWESILQANIIGCYNVFEAARRNGVKRVLFASSNHAVGFYKRDEKIDHRVYPKPDSRYGVSKAFGEQIGSLYADKYGLEVFCMRIGNVNPAPPDKRRLVDLDQSARSRAPGLGGHRKSEYRFRDRLWRVRQQAQLVRQFECAPARLPAAGRRRKLRRRSAGEGKDRVTRAPKCSRAAPSSLLNTAETRAARPRSGSPRHPVRHESRRRSRGKRRQS